MCACDDSVSRAEKFRRSIDGLKRGALIGCHPRNFCAQNDVFVGVRVGFVLRLTLDKQIGMCPPPASKFYLIVFTEIALEMISRDKLFGYIFVFYCQVFK